MRLAFWKSGDTADVDAGARVGERIGDSDAPFDEGMGPYGNYHKTADPVRPANRMVRFLSLGLIMSLGCNLLMVSTIGVLVPLKQAVPWILTVDTSYTGQPAMAEISPLKTTSDRVSVVAKAAAMEYVRVRHTIVADSDEMNRRWGTRCLATVKLDDQFCAFMKKRSTPEVYQVFKEQNFSSVVAMIEEQTSRRVTIDLEPIEHGPGFLEIRFLMTDTIPGDNGEPKIIRERRFAASMRYVFTAEKVNLREDMLNPLGFKVTSYQLSEYQ